MKIIAGSYCVKEKIRRYWLPPQSLIPPACVRHLRLLSFCQVKGFFNTKIFFRKIFFRQKRKKRKKKLLFCFRFRAPLRPTIKGAKPKARNTFLTDRSFRQNGVPDPSLRGIWYANRIKIIRRLKTC